SPTSLQGSPGVPLPTPPSVLVVDGDGNPAAGVTVTFAITTGAGSLTGPVQTTNAAGVATVGSWVLGAGANTLTANTPSTGTVFTGGPVTFTATGTTNDAFAGRFALSGNTVTTSASIAGFTAEAGEPADVAGAATTPSAWWTWTAPCAFTVSDPASFADTTGSNFDTVLAVFTGSSLSGLTLVASDNDSGGG